MLLLSSFDCCHDGNLITILFGFPSSATAEGCTSGLRRMTAIYIIATFNPSLGRKFVTSISQMRVLGYLAVAITLVRDSVDVRSRFQCSCRPLTIITPDWGLGLQRIFFWATVGVLPGAGTSMGTPLTGSRTVRSTSIVVIAVYIVWQLTIWVQVAASSCCLEVSGILTYRCHIKAVVQKNNTLVPKIDDLFGEDQCGRVTSGLSQ